MVESAASEEKKNDFIENSWVGKKMTFGKDVVLNITAPCTRCVMITLPQGDLPRDLGILSIVAKYNQVHVGVYASVERGGGIIHRGDTIQLKKIRVAVQLINSILDLQVTAVALNIESEQTFSPHGGSPLFMVLMGSSVYWSGFGYAIS